MFTFDQTDFQRTAVSALGAVAVSAAVLFATAAPVKAATLPPQTTAAWQAQVSDRIAHVSEGRAVRQPSALTKADVAAHFTADGDFAGATLVKSSGNRDVDARAVRVAGRIAYPPLPQGYRGQAQTVTLHLYFGDVNAAPAYAALQDRAARTIQLAAADGRGATQLAAR
jgi:hypothetical protein